MEQTPSESNGDFKPNIYPIIYWALAYGVAGGVLLFLLTLLSRYITVVWFPVFIAGLAWGGYRNYQRQKQQWAQAAGTSIVAQSPMNEFRAAVSDIAEASREVFAQDASDQQGSSLEDTAPLEDDHSNPPQQVPPQN